MSHHRTRLNSHAYSALRVRLEREGYRHVAKNQWRNGKTSATLRWNITATKWEVVYRELTKPKT